MPNLKIAIGSIKYDLSCQEDEKEIISAITKNINQKINLLSLDVGRTNEKILLLVLLIMNTKKIEKIKGKKFDENLINILKIISPLLDAKDDKTLEEKLIVANIMKESELMNVADVDIAEIDTEDNNDNGFDKEIHYKEMIELVDGIAGYVETLAKYVFH